MQEAFIIGLSTRQVVVNGPGLSVPRSPAVASGSDEIAFGLGAELIYQTIPDFMARLGGSVL